MHLVDRFPFELTIYATDQAHYVFKSSITGKAIERASIAELEQFFEREYPDLDLAAAEDEAANQVDRFQVYESLLLPLENVKGPLKYHPEGDMLYHSLQVFDHARDQLAYDEEFLTAALLHDVGKAIDPTDHVGGRPRSARRLHHRAHRLADRASHARASTGRRHASARGPGDGWNNPNTSTIWCCSASATERAGSRASKRPNWKRRSTICASWGRCLASLDFASFELTSGYSVTNSTFCVLNE